MSIEIVNALAFSKNEIREIPLGQIEPDNDQLRKEFKDDELDALAETIKNDGQIQPILVTKGKDGKYKIVDGERRWRVLNKLADQATATPESQTEPPSTIKAIYVEEDNQLLSVLGNIVRNNYNPMETADAYALLKQLLGKEGKKATNENVGNRVGKAPNTVSEYLSLLKLPEEIQTSARKDSRVPYNKLKTLEASNLTSDEKIKEYSKLYKMHSAKNVGQEANKDSKPNKETQRVVLIQKKIKAVNKALEMKAFKSTKFDDVKDEVKEDFKKSLETIKETVDKLIKEFPSQQIADKGD